jgi:hypothetical protein
MKMNADLQPRYSGRLGLICSLALAGPVLGNTIAELSDPLPAGGGETMFEIGLYGARLYGGWVGPPRIELQTPVGTFPDCTMWLPPMRVDPDGRVWGGQMVFYMHNQTEVLRIGFTNGHVDNLGFGAGPQTGGTITWVLAAGGVQIPPGLAAPLQGSWFYFEFHNAVQTPNGPTFTASFRCGARGVVGDLNCDGVVGFGDINPFVQSLSDPAGYANAFPWCDARNGDINGDGVENFGDINPFVALLSG